MAVLWLLLAVAVGDTLARPLLARAARPRRLATAFLAGFLAMTWATYVVAYLLRDRDAPLDLANPVVMAAAAILVGGRAAWTARRRSWGGRADPAHVLASPTRPELLDWAVLGVMALFVARLMGQTYWMEQGELHIAALVWSDFGPTTAIAQSFALGDNLPTEYPHFPGLPILYHFLYYFSVGNLTRLGLDPALASNVLSTASMVSLLALVMGLGRTVFASGVVGRLGAALFFVHGSLSWWPFVRSTALDRLPSTVWAKTDFLASGFPWRGEEWGIWTQSTFLNQRHLAGAIGILLIGVAFIVDRHQDWATARAAQAAQAARRTPPDPGNEDVGRPGRALDALDDLALEFQDRTRRPGHHLVTGLLDTRLLGYVVTGFLLGLLPMWNSAVFVGAAVVFAALFVLLPNRAQMLAVAVAAGSVALPQLLALRPTGLPDSGSYPIVHVGYTIEDPTLQNMGAYLLFTFGPKLLLAIVALAGAGTLQRALFLAFTALVGVAFGVQFSVEAFANHKFLNLWLIVLNLFAAAGLVRLWVLGGPRIAKGTARLALRIGGRAVAVAMVAVIAIGGVIDLMPIRNSGAVVVRLQGDRLFDWVLADTRPDEVFLTDLYVTGPILLAGRRIYYGWSYYAWSAGYPVAEREAHYKSILGATDAGAFLAELRDQHIAYLAVDDGMRSRGMVAYLNEPLFGAALGQPVFADTDGRYGHLVIYRVPPATPAAGSPGPGGGGPGSPAPVRSPGATAAGSAAPVVGGSMLIGGRGSQPGRFADPRGIAMTASLETLVADTGNHRLQRFAADGSYLGQVGGRGDQPGRFVEPNGVAVAANGHVFVADTGNHRVQELDQGLGFVRSWTGPPGGFYGPRDLATDPQGSLYVMDQGHARIVRLGPDGTVTTFGSLGAGAGQLNDPTGVAVSGGQVFIADPVNARIQVFTVGGAFVRSITVNGWFRLTSTADVAVSPDGSRLYATQPATGAISVISLTSAPGGTITPTGVDALVGPGALAVRPDGHLLVIAFDTPRVVLLPAPGQG